MGDLGEPLASLDFVDVVPEANWSAHPLLTKINQSADFDSDFVAWVIDTIPQDLEFFETVVLHYHFGDNGWRSAGPGLPGPHSNYLLPALEGRALDITWYVPYVLPFIADERRALIPKSEESYQRFRESLSDLTNADFIDAMNMQKELSSWVNVRAYYLKYMRVELVKRNIDFPQIYRGSPPWMNNRFVLDGNVLTCRY